MKLEVNVDNCNASCDCQNDDVTAEDLLCTLTLKEKVIIHNQYYNLQIIISIDFECDAPHLLILGAVKVPTTNAVIASEHVHGHHADGESHSGHNHLPGVGGHKQAMESEKSA